MMKISLFVLCLYVGCVALCVGSVGCAESSVQQEPVVAIDAGVRPGVEKEQRPDQGAPFSLFARQNLLAWAVVPFDAKKRGPAERAAMLTKLGLTRFAYDWRERHVPEFETEILALQKAEIEYVAFWGTHPQIAPLFQKHQIAPQIWWFAPSPSGTQKERIQKAVAEVLPQVKNAAAFGGTLGLYNHLGWGGEPKNLVAVVKHIRETHGLTNVGIVYNFHHGHAHIKDFSTSLALMLPYLLCVNLNGMNEKAQPKILTIGKGQHERAMIQTLRASAYRGPVGLIAHQETRDAETVLRENLEGLKQILKEQGDEAWRSF